MAYNVTDLPIMVRKLKKESAYLSPGFINLIDSFSVFARPNVLISALPTVSLEIQAIIKRISTLDETSDPQVQKKLLHIHEIMSGFRAVIMEHITSLEESEVNLYLSCNNIEVKVAQKVHKSVQHKVKEMALVSIVQERSSRVMFEQLLKYVMLLSNVKFSIPETAALLPSEFLSDIKATSVSLGEVVKPSSTPVMEKLAETFFTKILEISDFIKVNSNANMPDKEILINSLVTLHICQAFLTMIIYNFKSVIERKDELASLKASMVKVINPQISKPDLSKLCLCGDPNILDHIRVVVDAVPEDEVMNLFNFFKEGRGPKALAQLLGLGDKVMEKQVRQVIIAEQARRAAEVATNAPLPRDTSSSKKKAKGKAAIIPEVSSTSNANIDPDSGLVQEILLLPKKEYGVLCASFFDDIKDKLPKVSLPLGAKKTERGYSFRKCRIQPRRKDRGRPGYESIVYEFYVISGPENSPVQKVKGYGLIDFV